MTRAFKVTLKYATRYKRNQLQALRREYTSTVRKYIDSLWEASGRFDQATLNRIQDTRLSSGLKSSAFKQSLGVVINTKRSAKVLGRPCSKPYFTGSPVLNMHTCGLIEEGRKSFDLVIKFSTLNKGRRVIVPTRYTKVLRRWLSKPDAKLTKACTLHTDYVTVFVEIPDKGLKEGGSAIGVDIGLNKLIVDSDGGFYGTEFKQIRDRICRRTLGSKGRARACGHRDHYINQVVNSLPWNNIGVLGVEQLKDLKKGKSRRRSKSFRKAISPWTYRKVLDRIKCKAQESRTLLVEVNPANTSRTCPSCGWCDIKNRRGEDFLCVRCGHRSDSDLVGARNVFARTLQFLGSVPAPRLEEAVVL